MVPIYWISYVGWHASQGGMEWGYGSTGFSDLDTVLEFYKKQYVKAEDEILRTIKGKEDAK